MRTESEFNLIGKLYDWRWVQGRKGGVTSTYLHTNESTMHKLKSRGLADTIPRLPNMWTMTPMGKRFYELNYWLDQHHRQTAKEALINRNVQVHNGGWVNPKPQTQPGARKGRGTY